MSEELLLNDRLMENIWPRRGSNTNRTDLRSLTRCTAHLAISPYI